jgi:hypothetical protein
MRRLLTRAALAGVPFGIFMGVFFSFIFEDWILMGLAVGIFFGIGMAATIPAIRGRYEKNPPVVDGEDVLFQSPANHIRGSEGVGGWLMLTDHRLIFKPHRLNIQKTEWSVPLSDLLRLEPKRTLGFLPNGLRAITTMGEERFVVESRGPWLREFELAKSSGSME